VATSERSQHLSTRPSEDLGQALLNVDIRPIRMAYAVANGSEEDFRAAVLEASSRWGGIQEPILPVGNDARILDQWVGFLDLAPVDYICAVGEEAARNRDALQEQTGQEVVTLAWIQQHLTLHAVAAQPDLDSSSNVFGARRDDPITYLAALGAAWDQDQLGIWQQARMTVFPQPFGLAQLAGAQLNDSSLIAATGRQCGETRVEGITGGPIVVFFANPASVDDALWYWNFRALIPLRLPHFASCLVPEGPLPPEFRQLAEGCSRRQSYRYTPDVVAYSRNVPRSTTLGFMTEVGLVEDTSGKFSMQFPNPTDAGAVLGDLTVAPANPLQLVLGHRDFGQRTVTPTSLRRKQTIVDVESPVRFRLFGGQVRVRFSGPTAFSLPASLTAAKLFDNNALQAQGYVELATYPQNHYTFRLDVPDRMAVLSAYLADRRLTYAVSDKGRLAMGVQNATPDVGQLRDPVALSVIDALTTHRFEHELREVRKQFPGGDLEQLAQIARGLLDVRQQTRTLDEVFGELRRKEFDVNRPAVGALLVSLTDAGMVFRGLEANCHVCGMKSFIELRETTAPALCPGCRAQTTYSSDNSNQPVLHYRLNALLDRASDQGALGHLVVVAALRELYGEENVAHLPGVNLTTTEGTTKEADLLALVRGDVWLGEVKPRGGLFTEEQMDRDLALADLVGAKTYLMASLDGLDSALIASALAATIAKDMQLAILDAPTPTIRILTQHDLSELHSPPDAEVATVDGDAPSRDSEASGDTAPGSPS
jgi:hypothetical protein